MILEQPSLLDDSLLIQKRISAALNKVAVLEISIHSLERLSALSEMTHANSKKSVWRDMGNGKDWK